MQQALALGGDTCVYARRFALALAIAVAGSGSVFVESSAGSAAVPASTNSISAGVLQRVNTAASCAACSGACKSFSSRYYRVVAVLLTSHFPFLSSTLCRA